jgi:hypothetical protein
MKMKNTFEWYYFDIHSVDGYDVVVSFHTLPFSSVFSVSVVDIYVYKDCMLLLHHLIVRQQSELRQLNNPFCIAVDDLNYFKKNGNIIDININDIDIKMILIFKNLLFEEYSKVFELFPEISNKKSFQWRIHAPFCEAKGSLVWQGNEYTFKGKGYHDYNTGNIRLFQEEVFF